MFCSNCGRPDQTLETYCRGCGEFLADSSNPVSVLSRLVGADTPAKQVTISVVINLLTAAASIILVAFLAGYFDGREARTHEAAPRIVYLVYVFLGLVAAWQLFSFVINLNLKSRLGRRGEIAGSSSQVDLSSPRQVLPEANSENVVPISVAEEKTKILNK